MLFALEKKVSKIQAEKKVERKSGLLFSLLFCLNFCFIFPLNLNSYLNPLNLVWIFKRNAFGMRNEKSFISSRKSLATTVKILMFYFFLFYRLSQSTKLHPRVLITSIAKTQRGKFSRMSSLLACTPTWCMP